MFKQGELEVEERKVTKEDKKAIKITIAIILGLGLYGFYHLHINLWKTLFFLDFNQAKCSVPFGRF